MQSMVYLLAASNAASPPSTPATPIVPVVVTALVTIVVCVLGIMAMRRLRGSQARLAEAQATKEEIGKRDPLFDANKITLDGALALCQSLREENTRITARLDALDVALQAAKLDVLAKEATIKTRDGKIEDLEDRVRELERMVISLGGNPAGPHDQSSIVAVWVGRIGALEAQVRALGGTP